MTRFARAKGSKASNERVPENATSWAEMKQQLLEKNKEIEVVKKKQEADKEREKNYKAFLRDVEEEKAKNSQWADFPASKSSQKLAVENNGEESTEKPKKKKKLKIVVSEKADKSKKIKNIESMEQKNEEINSTELGKVGKAKKKKVIKVVKNNGDSATSKCEKKKPFKVTGLKNGDTNNNESVEKTENSKKKQHPKKMEQKKDVKRKLNQQGGEKGNKKVKKIENKDPPTEEQLKKIEKKKEKRLRQLEKKKLKQHSEIQDQGTQGQTIKKKPSKLKDNSKPHERRKKPQDRMIINGKEVEIAYVDGFPIKKEDAERIKQLRAQMISKGLPRSEIKIALKLERRKAEKAFAREKKKVCFNCRKSGHNLSECPEVGKELVESTGTGICFKCGSAEHTHFECKVVRGQEFKFAQCFICHEQGHIARQCPDNARGLYPKGGACRVCGDVTHLKKDCPKYQAEQQLIEQSLQIDTMGGDENPDSLGQNEEQSKRNNFVKRPNKIIKF